MTSPSSFSTAAQASASSNIVCGWDRYWLGWKGSKKQHDISALNTSNQEVVSDIENPIGEEVFVLRDLVTTGDAIRIKLPHINYLAPGNVKNQYIWIENHQLISPWDKNKLYDATCDPNSTSYKWKPGIYCYMQVGKDERTGNNIDPYNSTYANGSKDYLFPLSAEGSWDYYYNPAKKEQSWNGCLWMNKSIPYGTRYPDGSSLPNPFTGFSDQYGRLDENNDGVINENDQYNYKYQKYIGIPDPNATAPVPTLPAWGDQYDAFTQVGQKISIGTNPSSATIYTLKEGATSPMSFDNRKILLNNLSIEIINITTNSNGKQDYTVKIRWNDSEIKKSVRWCGNIILKPVSGYTPNITLRGGVGNITLDRGLSPVRMREESFGAGLTEPTFLHLMAGTTTTLKTGSFINVFNGSTFHVQAGATLILEPNTIIETDSDPLSKICIEDGANVILQDPNTSKIKINGKLYGYDYLLQNLNLSTAQDDYYALNTITTAGGLIVPNTGNVNLKAKNKIELTPGTSLAANSNQLITIEILPSPYICEPQFYNTKLRALAQNNSSSDYVETNTSIMKRSAYNSIENTTKGIDLGYLFTIYPNPSSGVFTISFPDKNEQAHESEPMNVEIYNSMGDNVYSVQNTSATTLQVDLKSQPKGVYIVRVVKNNGEIKTSKISLQ
jgi:hypothetical protein